MGEHETTAEERLVSENITNTIAWDRLAGGLNELQFCQVLENMAYGLAQEIHLKKPEHLMNSEDLIGFLGLERDNFSVYADVARIEDPEADWNSAVEDIYAMIVKNGQIMGDFNAGVIGVHKIDQQTWGFTSINAYTSEEGL